MNKQDVLNAIEVNNSHPGFRYYSVMVSNPGESALKAKHYYQTVGKYDLTPNFDELVDLVLSDWKDKPFSVTKGTSIGIYEKSFDGKVGTFFPNKEYAS